MNKSLLFLILASVSIHSHALTTLPDGYTPCAVEGATCSVPSPGHIIYGAPGNYTDPVGVSTDTLCTNETFGTDPAYGTVKACYFLANPSIPIQNGRFPYLMLAYAPPDSVTVSLVSPRPDACIGSAQLLSWTDPVTRTKWLHGWCQESWGTFTWTRQQPPGSVIPIPTTWPTE